MKTKRILELTVVYPAVGFALLASLALVASPHRCWRFNANETAAIATLRNLASAQQQFRDAGTVDLDRDGRPEYGTFRELSAGGFLRGDEALGRLDPPVLSGAFRHPGPGGEVWRSGYCFRVYLSGPDGTPLAPDRQATGYAGVSADLAEEHWCAYAWPEVLTKKQRRLLFVDENGVVFGTPLEASLGRTGPLPGSNFFPGPSKPAVRDRPDQRTWHEIR
jgi:hypothetical protein